VCIYLIKNPPYHRRSLGAAGAIACFSVQRGHRFFSSSPSAAELQARSEANELVKGVSSRKYGAGVTTLIEDD
jgi:hypothetical protein